MDYYLANNRNVILLQGKIDGWEEGKGDGCGNRLCSYVHGMNNHGDLLMQDNELRE